MKKPSQILYSTSITSTNGRDGGASKSTDDRLDVKLSLPQEMHGDGGPGTNPEQLFGAGYSACFLGAMKHVAGSEKITVSKDAKVTAVVGFGPTDGGFAITLELQIKLPNLDKAAANDLIAKAHEVCPYSNATRNGLDVKLTLVD